MDAIRILCDLQHSDSNTRRNFILFALKKEMKEHLTKTIIDGFLFGEQLCETLKSAKAVTKSGAELKPDSENRNVQGRPCKPGPSRPLNRKAPPARRPPGPAASTSRNYEPAHWTRPAPPLPQPALSSRQSYRHQAPAPRPSQRRRP
ncbi:hypothetical protein O3G_MSEX011152 [Manduca sexta]|uniref:Uncharacterized protein n=1 Tax=Manduca sexta TaxID=7130 RepID=A0A921ZK07_MANSE|nr:hypothetical protein O3G_MSEX011152 [Manduca sexta]